MGFGYLLIGYLCTFVLYLTVAELGIGGAALLLGYGLMMYGLSTLTLYNRAFVWAKWLCVPLFVTALYDLLASLSELFLWGLAFVNGRMNAIYEWCTFALIIIFNFAMLYAIRAIATDVELPHVATKAIRNMIFVALYAVLNTVAKLPFVKGIENYLALPVVLMNFVWIICNLLLLISCNKNICRAGDEDQPAKPSRFKLLNRLNETYERNRQRAIDNTTREAEEVLRRRQEARQSKNSKKKKRKK